MNKILFVLLALASLYGKNICAPHAGGEAVLFVNGIMNTSEDARNSLNALRTLHGDYDKNGNPIQYDFLYNQTEGFFTDIAEVIGQRDQEKGYKVKRYELFFDVVTGKSTLAREAIRNNPAMKDEIDAMRKIALDKHSKILAMSSSNPNTIKNYVEHISRVEQLLLHGKKIVLVAHSQGNLFANKIYQYTLKKYGKEVLKVIHIAPASRELNGEYFLADTDIVIRALRGNPDPTHEVKWSTVDPSGHSVLGTYLKLGSKLRKAIGEAIQKALETMPAPEQIASNGFWTAILTWDGSGDVDLHVNEPSGSHVFYNNKMGVSGYLDVDNTSAFGPEHYYASCDDALLQDGTYAVSVANYSGAQGRTAHVQISSIFGVLDTKSVTLGAPTGSTPDKPLFTVKVEKDAKGVLKASLVKETAAAN